MNEKGTLVVKFFLHVSKDEQKERIQERLKNRSKNWKFSKSDVLERKYWKKYQSAFDLMIENTHTQEAPWVIVPADDKWFRDYIIYKTLFDRLSKLRMSFPKAET